MAKDVITRFKLETTQYDSKLRDASKSLSEFSRTASIAGNEFDKFTKKNVEAARALGNMSPSATNAKDKVKELVGAFNDVARAYNALTQTQQQSDFGKAMAQSLTQLQQKIRETKQEMQGMSMPETGGNDGISGMLQVFGGNLLTKASAMVANLGGEVLDCMNQAAALATEAEGIELAFQRLGRGDILEGLRQATHGTVSDLELMKAAVKFNDFKLPLDQLGTMLAFAQQKAKDTGQSVDYMVDSIVTGLGRKSLMILDNLGLSAAQIKEKMKETGDMTVAVGEIIREEMSKSGDYVETAADRAAQASVEMENAMLELGKAMKDVFGVQFSGWGQVATVIKKEVVGTITFTIETIGKAKEALQGFINWTKSLVGGVTGSVAGAVKESSRQQMQKWLNDKKVVQGGTTYTVTETVPPSATTPTPTKKTGGVSRSARSTTTAKVEEVFPEGSMKALQKEMRDLQEAQARVTTPEEWQAYGKKIDDVTEKMNTLKGVVKETKAQEMVQGLSGVTGNSLKANQSYWQGKLGGMEIGSEEYMRTQANIIDTQSFNTILNEAMKRDVSISDETKESIMQGLIDGESVREELISLVEIINETLADSGIEPIKLDFDTGNLTNETKEVNKEWNAAASAIQAVGSAMSQIEDPAAKVLGTIAQAVATMALSYAEASKAAAENPANAGWGWIAFAATGLATMLSSISAIKQATSGFANGGVIPGNSMSGDNLRGMTPDGNIYGLNSQEIILNKAQQGNLASQLTDSAVQGFGGQPYVEGEKIFLGMNNSSRRMGRGEIVTTQTLRRMGLTR